MPSKVSHRLLARGARRVPGLKRLPILKVLAIAEIALLARDHVSRLSSSERHRLVELVRRAMGDRATSLTTTARSSRALVAKAEPRRFAALAADKLSPVPLPKRLLHGPSR